MVDIRKPYEEAGNPEKPASGKVIAFMVNDFLFPPDRSDSQQLVDGKVLEVFARAKEAGYVLQPVSNKVSPGMQENIELVGRTRFKDTSYFAPLKNIDQVGAVHVLLSAAPVTGGKDVMHFDPVATQDPVHAQGAVIGLDASNLSGSGLTYIRGRGPVDVSATHHLSRLSTPQDFAVLEKALGLPPRAQGLNNKGPLTNGPGL